MVSCLMGDSTALASAIVRCCLNYHDSYGKKYNVKKELTWSKLFLEGSLGYRAE